MTDERIKQFKEKCETAMNQSEFGDLKQHDLYKWIFEYGATLMSEPLDKMNPDTLIRMGGKLAGLMPNLGQDLARARAERDVYEQKAKEMGKEIVLSYLANGEYKVTEAKARAELEMTELSELVVIKDGDKNKLENLHEACRAMVSFIQSVLSLRKQSLFNDNLENNAR